MHNPLKRQSSFDDFNDPSHNHKRSKPSFNDALSPHLQSYIDHTLNGSNLPPSPPIIVDTPLPPCAPLPLSIDSIPTLRRFTITTRQQPPTCMSDYANINQILYEAHQKRHKESMTNEMDTDMMEDGTNYYDYANAILRQAFLQRHPSPPG